MVAVFLAVAFDPVVEWLVRRGLPRVVAIVLVYLALLLLAVGITALLLPSLTSQDQALVTLVIDLVRDPPGGTPQAALQELADSYARGGYVNEYLAVNLIVGVATYIAPVLLGVPYTLALVMAFFDLIPLIETSLGAIIVIVVGLFTSPVILVAYFVAYQQVENHILQPLIYSRSVHLHPIVVFLTTVTGAELLGIKGALLSIPVAEVVRLRVGWVHSLL